MKLSKSPPAAAPPANEVSPGSLLRLLAGWLLDYVRWTQFIPMVIGWGGALFILGGLCFGRFAIGFEKLPDEMQAEFWSAPGVQETIVRLEQSIRFLGERYQTPDGSFDPGPFVREAWSLLALLGFLLGQLLNAFGVRPSPGTPGRKIRVAGVISLLTAGAAIVLLLSFGEALKDGPFAVAFFGLSIAAVPFLLSCWGLWISDRIRAIEVWLELKE